MHFAPARILGALSSFTFSSVLAATLLLATSASAQEPLPPPSAPAASPPANPAAGTAETSSPTAAPASPPTPVPAGKQFPAVGGHFGFAVPIATVGGSNVAIGKDFVTLGLTPGITVHLDDKWAVDFEFIAFNEVKNTPARTTFVVDPGVIRKFDGFVAGMRIATQVGAPTNGGIVPILVVPFKLSEKVVYFVEADVPVFLRDNGSKAELTATFLFQSGFGF